MHIYHSYYSSNPRYCIVPTAPLYLLHSMPKLMKVVLPNLTVKQGELLIEYCILINMPSPAWCDSDLLKGCFDLWADVTYDGIVEAEAVRVVTVPPPVPDPELTAFELMISSSDSESADTDESADWPDTDESAIYEQFGQL